MIRTILKIARSVVRNVTQVITGQINLIQDAVTAPLRSMVQQVVGGVWRGEGANRFVAEMTSEIIPQLTGVGSLAGNFGGLINRALDVMDRADRQATSKANALMDVFQKIVNF
jgi:phage-related protein